MIEVTVQVFESLENAQLKLKNLGYELLESYSMEDSYFSRFDMEELMVLNFETIAKNSILVRMIKTEHPFSLLTFKNKTFDENGDVINEEKIQTRIAEPDVVKQVLTCANLNNYANLKTDLYVYRKGDIFFALQNVEGLGVFIEYEEDNTMESLTKEQKRALIISRLKELELSIGEDFNCKKVYMMLHR